MERFLALLRLLSRRRRGRRYRADDDYQEGYEDVYYYTSKYNTHLLSESHRDTMERESLSTDYGTSTNPECVFHSSCEDVCVFM